MQRYRSFAAAVTLLLATFGIAHSAEVLQQAPRDALGLLVVRNLSEADAKASRVLSAFGSHLPGPLALLKSIAGIQAGLDERRDLMLVLLPTQANSPRLSLALWLPVNDYAALVHSLDGDPGRRVAAVTLAGEDLLVVQQDDWAVLMDPDQRDRLEMLGETKQSPPQDVEEWASWVDTNDATVVVLPAGRQAAWAWAESEDLFSSAPEPPPADVPIGQQLFGRPTPRPRPSGNWPAIRQWIRSVVAERPELADWAVKIEGGACGVRFAPNGDTVVGVKLAIADDAAAQTTLADPLPIYSGGEFVLTGSGSVSPQWVIPAVAPYVRQVANELANEYATPVDEQNVVKFRQAVEQAIAEIRSFAVLTRPGVAADAVFSNNFLVLRVASADEFLALVAQSVECWNEMLGDPQSALKLAFKSKSISVTGHDGTEYSVDIVAAINEPATPAMNKLFGPESLFRLQSVKIDPTTVLLTCATEVQIAQIIAEMNKKLEPASDRSELRDTAILLDQSHDWHLFFSPHGYTAWMKRQMDAVLGPVIGGPVVPQFPKSPPLGIAGGVDGQVLWIEAAAPIETIRSAATFQKK
jgi:hypothetical protein